MLLNFAFACRDAAATQAIETARRANFGSSKGLRQDSLNWGKLKTVRFLSFIAEPNPMHYKKKPASARFKNVQCVPRVLVDGRIRVHHYHRPTRTRLPAPESHEFGTAYEEAERQLAALQKDKSAKLSPSARQNSESHSVALPVVPQSLSPPLRPSPLSEIRPVPRRGLSRIEAAVYLGVSPGKFDQLVDDGRMPAPRRIDRRKVWDRYEIDVAFDALPSENPLSQASTWDDFRSP
jgi:excisionase family DNA binding protein